MEEKMVGTVRELFVYPVKSMRGIPVPAVSCYWYGVNGDRKYAFTQSGDLSGFPWLTGRELPALLQYEPYFVQPDAPLQSPIRVKTPQGADLPLESPALQRQIEAGFGGAIELLRLKRGTFDSMPLSIFAMQTLADLEEAAGISLDIRRFRPNIVVESVDGQREDAWSGAALMFGRGEEATRIQVNHPIKRCVMINLDPDSVQSEPRILKTVARENNSLAGIYASVSRPGAIRVGDPVFACG